MHGIIQRQVGAVHCFGWLDGGEFTTKESKNKADPDCREFALFFISRRLNEQIGRKLTATSLY